MEQAIEFIGQHDFLEGYLIYSDEAGEMKSWVSEGIRELIIDEK
jgi:hypothetical protein